MIEFPVPFSDLLNNNMRSDINGFYCRHTSCTKKFVNSQSRSRHEKNCQYRKKEPKVKNNDEKPKMKQLSVDSAQLFYQRVNSSVQRTRYSDIDIEKMSRGGKYAIRELRLQHNISELDDEMITNRNNYLSRQMKIDKEDSTVQESTNENIAPQENIVGEDDDQLGKSSLPEISVSSPTIEDSPSYDEETSSITSQCTVTDEDTTTGYELPKDTTNDNSIDKENNHSHSYRCKLFSPCEKRENELFCISLVDTLDKLDSRKQRLAKVKIQQVLYDLEYNC